MNTLFIFLWATLCGAGANEMKIPLPWVLGPMFGVAFLTLAGYSERQPGFARKLGQILIGAALGLYFTQQVLAEVLRLGGWIVLGAVFSLALTALFSGFVQRFARVDGTTALYSSAIGAASDMAVQAQRFGADGASVASSHAVRVMIVVTVIPFLVSDMNLDAARLLTLARGDLPAINHVPLLGVIVGGIVLAWLLEKTRFPNPWLISPLAVASLYAVTGHDSRMPDELIAFGSVLLGWNLGQYINRDFFVKSPRVVAASAMMTVGMLLLSFAFAYGISQWVDLPLVTTLVATSPGGIAEMAITAKVLAIGAPIVTAFHFIRLLCVITMIEYLGRVLRRTGWLR